VTGSSATGPHGPRVSQMFSPRKKTSLLSHEIYAVGEGLIVTFIDAQHLCLKLRCAHLPDILIFYCKLYVFVFSCTLIFSFFISLILYLLFMYCILLSRRINFIVVSLYFYRLGYKKTELSTSYFFLIFHFTLLVFYGE